MPDDERTLRCRAYLDAILTGTTHAPNLSAKPLHDCLTWKKWLLATSVISADTTKELNHRAAEWFGHTVERALHRIDDIARRRSASLDDAESLGKEWAHRCSNGPIELISEQWGNPQLAIPSNRLLEVCQTACQANRIREAQRLDSAHYGIFNVGYSRTPVLAVFPCYLTASRQRSWSVIPFGLQERLALVATERCLRNFAEIENVTPLSTLESQSSIDADDFRSLVQHIPDDSRLYYFGIGHAAFQIALDVVRSATDHAKLRSRLCDSSSDDSLAAHTYASLQQGDARIGSETLRKGRVDALLTELAGGSNLLLTDMGVVELEWLRTSAKIPTDMKWVAFDHGLTIPVGLGFSLCTVPIFLKQPLLLKALAEGVAEYADTHKDTFTQYGVDVRYGKFGHFTRAVKVAMRSSSEVRGRSDAGQGHTDAESDPRSLDPDEPSWRLRMLWDRLAVHSPQLGALGGLAGVLTFLLTLLLAFLAIGC